MTHIRRRLRAWIDRMGWFGPLSLALVACGGAERQTCYASAELVHAQRARAACGAGWESCPERQAILDSLEGAYRECP
jgi:hypothetical protein